MGGLLAVLAAGPLVVQTSAAFAPCLEPAVAEWGRRTGRATTVVVREAESTSGADVMVGDDVEMTRLLEGGGVRDEADLGYVPWVLTGGREVSAQAASAEVLVLGGAVGRSVAAGWARHGVGRLRSTVDVDELRRAPRALLPRSLASPPYAAAIGLRPLVATAGIVAGSPRAEAGRALVAALKARSEAGGTCLTAAAAADTTSGAAASYARSVVASWIPSCSLQRTAHGDVSNVIGAPDAARLAPDRFRGMTSLGQGGWITVDLGLTVNDARGPEIRVYQAVSGEPVSLYASAAPEGPFRAVALQEYCGHRSTGVFSNHCDFDLARGGVASARYLRVEDGELYPCLAGTTASEGADIDAIEVLGVR